MPIGSLDAYVDHYHLRDLRDIFVSQFVRTEYEKGGIIGAGRAHALQSDAGASVESGDSEQQKKHPQQHVVTAMREFLQAHQRERDAWRAAHRYVILLCNDDRNETCNSEVAKRQQHAGEVITGIPDPYAAEAMNNFAQQIAQVTGALVLIPPAQQQQQQQEGGSTHGAPTMAPFQQQQQQQEFANKFANIMRGVGALDPSEQQKHREKFRASTVDAVVAHMNTASAPAEAASSQSEAETVGTPAAAAVTLAALPTVIVASHWPSSIADALAIEHALGKPQAVIHFFHSQAGTMPDNVVEEGIISEELDAEDIPVAPGMEEGCTEAAIELQRKQRRLQRLMRAASFTDRYTERAALLEYYRATHALQVAEVSDKGLVVDAELIVRAVAQLSNES